MCNKNLKELKSLKNKSLNLLNNKEKECIINYMAFGYLIDEMRVNPFELLCAPSSVVTKLVEAESVLTALGYDMTLPYNECIKQFKK